VLTEVLNYFCDHGTRSRLAAVEAVRRALRQFSVVSTDRALFKRAVDRYAARPDKQFSLTDCISMVLMEDLGITHVLTNDHHFVQAGFTIVNE
jgi:predicted nucleic acid-binding protein